MIFKTLRVKATAVSVRLQIYLSMLKYTNREYKGWIGLSPPAAYPLTIGNEANKGSL
jgi:hypothetical protein